MRRASSRKRATPAAPAVASAVKEWAITQGVTHFCHWFQPQTGLTAEKHDAFLTLDGTEKVLAGRDGATRSGQPVNDSHHNRQA